MPKDMPNKMTTKERADWFLDLVAHSQCPQKEVRPFVDAMQREMPTTELYQMLQTIYFALLKTDTMLAKYLRELYGTGAGAKYFETEPTAASGKAQSARGKKAKETPFLEEMAHKNLFANAEYHQLEEKIKELEKSLADANDKIKQLEGEPDENRKVDHEDWIAEAFCEISQRYLEATKNKTVANRTKIKKSLHDIMAQLKMFNRIPTELQACINNFDDKDAPVIPQVTVLGDYVVEKKVDTQIGRIAKGGAGQIVNPK